MSLIPAFPEQRGDQDLPTCRVFWQTALYERTTLTTTSTNRPTLPHLWPRRTRATKDFSHERASGRHRLYSTYPVGAWYARGYSHARRRRNEHPFNEPRNTDSLGSAAGPEPVITQVAANKPIDEAQFAALTPQQRTAVRNAQSSVSGPWPGKAKARPGAFVVAGGLCLFVIVMSFVGALLGWILVMRKRVLICTRCGAVVPAS